MDLNRIGLIKKISMKIDCEYIHNLYEEIILYLKGSIYLI